jgi:hypothetical protein
VVETAEDSTQREQKLSSRHSAPSQQKLPHRQYQPQESRAIGSSANWFRAAYQKLDQGRPAHAYISHRAFWAAWAYLAALTGLVYVYRIEGRAFQIVLGTTLATLPLYEIVPFRLKKPLAGFSAAVALAMIFGNATAACALGFAALMVGLARLSKIGWQTRAAVIASIAIILAVVRSTSLANSLPPTFWPVAGTMLMFRLMLYMYELKHAKNRETLSDAVSYFLILPNWCFMHFPVVDYRTLQRGFYAKDITLTRRRGLQMMFVGVTHLLCYRVVYHELLIRPQDVTGLATLGAYLACNYLLYLRVSGQFHVACGLLHLYGHHMPETHNKYLLAHSFTDYWRRINIYWKDFMVKTVFNPVFFRLRKRPQPVALGVATVAVFVATWALHAWQSFWLRGHWGFSLTDALFWGILGAAVLVNVQLDARRKPGIKAESKGIWSTIRYGTSIGGMLLSITLLWSLWSSASLAEWLSMMKRGLSQF